MEENKLKVLITTSGLGTRLGYISKYTNKSLVKIGDKPTISHIIDLYPDADFVITLGYFGDYVKQFLELAYPERNFEFVYVNPYQGEGSGLVKSISFAKEKLQCPFIFHVCDTIIKKAPPIPDTNWMACVKSEQPDIFRTVCTNGNKITKINEKGEINYDYAYIGIAGIFDYKLFWNKLDYILENKNINDSSDCHIFMQMVQKTDIHLFEPNEWYDTGNVEHLNRAKSKFIQRYDVLDKSEESIYFLDNSVIKFFSDKEICTNRVKRAKILDGLVPKIIEYKDNFYKYELADGELLANCVTEDKLSKLFYWANEHLWKPEASTKINFASKCYNFYFHKTISRVKQFLTKNGIEDKIDIINEIEVPTCETMFEMIDWESICRSLPSRFHGDFILDNILFNGDSFVLLDWRQDFAGEISVGDKYYDLSKLNHNLTLNHHMLLNGYYDIKMSKNGIHCDVFRSNNMVQCQQTFWDLLKEENLDVQRIKILTALIWLNMSPLHEYPLNNFLFYFGKYNLWKELKKKI
jgi:choline kinase